MKKKIVALCVAALLACSSMTGCAGNSSSVNSNAESNTASMGASSESGDKMTISVVGIDWGYGPKSDSAMEQYWEKLFDEYLDIQWVNYEDYSQKVNTLIASGSQPDVTEIYNTNGTYYYSIFTQAIDAGEFLDMTPYINGDDGLIKTNAVMKTWSDSIWKQATYNKGIYILPRSISDVGKNSGIEVRKDLMEKYGYTDEPTTMDELNDWLVGLSDAATKGEGQKIYGLDFSGDDFMDDSIKAFAIAFTDQTDWAVDKDGNFTYMQFNDKYIDFLNWMKGLYDAGVLDPEFALGNSDTSDYKAGNSVAYLNAWYNFNQSADLTSNKIFDSGTPDTYETWELLPVKGPEAYTVSPNYTDIESCIAISSKCSQDKIDKIMETFNATEETYPGYDTLMSDGIEGVHYKLLPDGTKDTSDTAMGQARQDGYVGAWNQIFLKVNGDKITEKFERTGTKKSSDEVIQRAKDVKAFIESNLQEIGMTNAISNLVSKTYDSQWSAFTDDVNTMCTQYVMGQIDENDWKDFVSGLVSSDTYKTIQSEFKEAAKNAE